MRKTIGKLALLSGLTFFVFLYSQVGFAEPTVTVSAKLGPLKGGSNADDPAIWLHPTDHSKSLMFLSDKDLGVYAFDFGGKQIQHMNLGTSLNNVDVRYGFNYGGQNIDIVAGNLRDAGKLFVAKINPSWTQGNAITVLSDKGSSGNSISGNSYGFTLYKRLSDGTMFVFEKPKSSAVIKQWKVSGDGSKITTTDVRSISGMGVAEGFVADDELGYVYFAEESKGIHKYYADPDHANANSRVNFFASGDGTKSDREGLSIYICNDGTGYLILSSQGNDQFKIYERQGNNQFVKTMVAKQSKGTDGLDSSSAAVPGFPKGFLVIHDDPSMTYYVYDWLEVAQSDLTVCVNGGSGCTSHDRFSCFDGDVYWYESCGGKEEKKEECGDRQCVGGVCVVQCVNHHHVGCYGGDVYWYDSCNNREELKEDCGSSQCSGGVCQTGACIAGDLNCDDVVDIFDLVIVARDFGKTSGFAPRADTNGDNHIDIFDLVLVAQNFGVTGGELDISVCDPANGPFSLNIDNEWLPFPVGMVHVLEGMKGPVLEKVQISVLNQTEVVAGVVTRVVEEREWEDDELLEVSRNFFAQAPDGTVCYFGEDVDDYIGGRIVGHIGQWRAGEGDNKAGILMPANPAVGMMYQQEMAPYKAMDRGEIVAMGETYTTPAGTFTDVMVVYETSPLDLTGSRKRYQRGIGMIFDHLIDLTSY